MKVKKLIVFGMTMMAILVSCKRHPSFSSSEEALQGCKQQLELLSLFALDLDATAMAKALGCSRNTVARWEQGRITPKTATLLAVASITGVNPEWLTDAGAKS